MSDYIPEDYNVKSDYALTVTITLAEYRELCRESAAHDGEMQKLKLENRDLRDELKKINGRMAALLEEEGE